MNAIWDFSLREFIIGGINECTLKKMKRHAKKSLQSHKINKFFAMQELTCFFSLSNPAFRLFRLIIHLLPLLPTLLHQSCDPTTHFATLPSHDIGSSVIFGGGSVTCVSDLVGAQRTRTKILNICQIKRPKSLKCIIKKNALKYT